MCSMCLSFITWVWIMAICQWNNEFRYGRPLKGKQGIIYLEIGAKDRKYVLVPAKTDNEIKQMWWTAWELMEVSVKKPRPAES